ncbi:MAG: tRNA-uridine aminocarboxypropyltransferase [Planctomycetota bacterium]
MRIDPAEYHRENRCPACRLTRRLCICADLPSCGIPFELVVMQHVNESSSLSNTGSLAARVLQPSQVVEYRGRFEGEFGPDSLLLYPQSDAEPLSPEHLPTDRLIVLDATWRQARRMYRKTAALRGLKVVTLPPGIEPRWVLRQPPAPGMLCTAEAIAGAVRALGIGEAADVLDGVIDDFMPRALHVMRRIPYADVPRNEST